MSAGNGTGRTLIMGVLNVTPDSFSDGGDHNSYDAAVAHARALIAQGAHIIDVGGESTRPGSERISPDTEIERVLRVVKTLAPETTVSVDTIHARTAREVIAAGAHIINDVSGGLHDPEMLDVVAAGGAEIVLQHWRGIPDPNHSRSHYDDVVTEVVAHLAERAEAAMAAGIPRESIILDPGLGFDKTTEQGWELLRRLPELQALGYRVLIGASRKRMLKDLLDTVPGAKNAPKDRDLATSVITALCAQHGAWAVRVHDVNGSAQALAVVDAWPAAAPTPALTPTPTATSGSDAITLTGITVFAHHGVLAHERENGQEFVIDAKLSVDLRAASASDALEHTVNYAEVTDAIVNVVAGEPVDLIETLAERVAAVVLRFTGVRETTVTIHKPAAPIAHRFADVSVTITRSAS